MRMAKKSAAGAASATRDDPRTVVAVDLGSNSFHVVVARWEAGRLRVVDRLRERIALAAGLDEEGNLSEESQREALACLARFGQRLRDVPARNVRVVATNTFRAARNAKSFLPRSERALGHSIDVISGREEARLAYLGVCHNERDDLRRRLVVDMGGGSTQLIVGERADALLAECLYMGCVSWTTRHFPGGRITRKRMRDARIAARLEVQTIVRAYRQLGWETALGASGTILTIADALERAGRGDGAITPEGLEWLRDELIAAERPEDIDIDGIDEERAEVIAGGLAILLAIFDGMGLERMRPTPGALREGVLLDLLGRFRHEDVRDRTIRGFAERHRADLAQAARVERTALRLLDRAGAGWGLVSDDDRSFLSWAARVHEVGLAVTFSGHHRHGAYLVQNSDMPGFSRQEQDVLAALVRAHRRSIGDEEFAQLPEEWRSRALRLAAILRIAVRLNRGRTNRPLPAIEAKARLSSLTLSFPDRWLDRHPLTRADLDEESAELAEAGITLRLR